MNMLQMKILGRAPGFIIGFTIITRRPTAFSSNFCHDGAFRLSFDSEKPILPALIFNSKKVLPQKFFFFWPGKIELHYLSPVSQKDFSSVEKLKEHVFNVMAEYYLKNSG